MHKYDDDDEDDDDRYSIIRIPGKTLKYNIKWNQQLQWIQKKPTKIVNIN